MITINASGNVGKDAEVRTIANKEYVCFSIAADETKNGNERVTTWVRVNMFKGSGKLDEYVKKGAVVEATGKLAVSVYNGKPDVTLWADRVGILKFAESAAQTAAPAQEPATKEDDMPFFK